MPALKAGGQKRMEAYAYLFDHPEIRRAVAGALSSFRAKLEKSFPRLEGPRLRGSGRIEVNSYIDHFFTEAFIVLDRKIRHDEIRGSSFPQLKSFLASTSRFKCIEWLRREKPTEEISEREEDQLTFSNPDTKLKTKQQVEVLESLLRNLSENCRKILSLEAMGYDNQEITRELEFKNSNVLKTSKNRCKKRLYELIRQDDEYLDLFQEYLK